MCRYLRRHRRKRPKADSFSLFFLFCIFRLCGRLFLSADSITLVRKLPDLRTRVFRLPHAPYIPSGDIPGLDASVRDYEPHMALDGGADGLDFYRAICAHWRSVLHPGSRLCFEVGIGQADDVLRLMRSVGFGDLEILPDPAGIPRVVLGDLYQEI